MYLKVTQITKKVNGTVNVQSTFQAIYEILRKKYACELCPLEEDVQKLDILR